MYLVETQQRNYLSSIAVAISALSKLMHVEATGIFVRKEDAGQIEKHVFR